MPEDFKVTPWEVTGDIDYDLLQERFGTTPIDDALIERLSKYGEVHPMIRRGIFYSHRDMIPLLNEYDKGNKFVLYTGRGPSGNTHLGHIMPWIFNKWVQDTFGVDMLFQMTDDEKFLFKDLTLGDTSSMAYENALDFIALGFDPKKTRIIVNTKNIDKLYPIALRVSKKVTFSTAKAVFGFDNSTNIGSIFYTTLQSVPAFLPTEESGKQTPVLIPCGIDQDPHFRVTRDVAPGLNYPKPSLLYCKMFPGLNGGDKMSSSDENATIYTTDTPKAVINIVNGGSLGIPVVRNERSMHQQGDHHIRLGGKLIDGEAALLNHCRRSPGELQNILLAVVRNGYFLSHC